MYSPRFRPTLRLLYVQDADSDGLHRSISKIFLITQQSLLSIPLPALKVVSQRLLNSL